MELILENEQKIYMEESLDGAVARLYDENGFFDCSTGIYYKFLIRYIVWRF